MKAKAPSFIGREYECKTLQTLAAKNETARLLIVYGRRRVGKTELLEHNFKDRNMMKFEGIEGQDEAYQRARVLEQLAQYVNDPWLTKIKTEHWGEVFALIAKYVGEGLCTLYFEEVQWLAHYRTEMIAELKFAWDNFFQKNPELIVILCGSSPSFMIEKVVKSKALYNRSQHELFLKPFSLQETAEFLAGRGQREVMDAYLLIGGIPEYLKWLKQDSSVLLSLCKQSFTPTGFFTSEYARIFTSSLADNKHYQKIVEFLSAQRFATRDEIAKHLKISSGGMLTELLQDLTTCGFISRYTPFHTGPRSLLARYAISDAYLQFYFKFIKPQALAISDGQFIESPLSALKMDTLQKWLGFSFERFCRAHHAFIAKLLGFHAVRYRSGVFFNRNIEKSAPGYQLDLVFERDDHVYTICEIKYLQIPASTEVIAEFEKKLALFPNPKQYSIHKVLISAEGAEPALIDRHYFDTVLCLSDFLNRS